MCTNKILHEAFYVSRNMNWVEREHGGKHASAITLFKWKEINLIKFILDEADYLGVELTEFGNMKNNWN